MIGGKKKMTLQAARAFYKGQNLIKIPTIAKHQEIVKKW
jgi:hypothetical protein